MKSRNNRLFWTELGARLLGESPTSDVSQLPSDMMEALNILPDLPWESATMRGQDLQGKRGRHIYTHTWNILRDMGFSRPLRCEVFPGINLFIPFVKGSIAVLPQGFQNRIPPVLRAHALVGKSAAVRSRGYHLVVSAAVYNEKGWSILSRGRCSVCTVDNLKQLITALDLQQRIKQI